MMPSVDAPRRNFAGSIEAERRLNDDHGAERSKTPPP